MRRTQQKRSREAPFLNLISVSVLLTRQTFFIGWRGFCCCGFGGIIGGVYTGFNPRINDWLKACQCFMEGVAADLGAAAGAVQGVGVRGGGGHGGQVLIELGHEGPVDMILPAPYPVPGHRQAAATTGNGIFAAGG